MNKLLALLVAIFASAAPATAAPARPKLVVAISVDQLSADLFEQYRPHFTGGLKRIAGGVAYGNGYQAHATTETCPGHATILTGAHPARSGIIANHWIDFAAPRADKQVYCAEDERLSAPGGGARISPVHLRVPTLGDRMKRADSRSRTVAVGGKDRSAVMMGGQAADQAWWWSNGRFVSNGASPAPVAERVNQAIAAAIARPRPPLVPPGFCGERDRAIPLAGGNNVGTFRFARAAGDAAAFGQSPEVDAATLTMAAALVQQLQLGRGPAPDLLAVGLAASDFIGHRYGSGGVEMCLQLMSLDSDLGGFLRLLDGMGLDYLVVLTADHGGRDIPERRRLQGAADATRLDPALTRERIGDEVARRLGLAGPIFVGNWYLAPTVPASRRAEALALAGQLLGAHPQVHKVYDAAQVAAQPIPRTPPESWSVLDRLRASYVPGRSPDLFVVHQPNVTPIANPTPTAVATHGSVWDHDRRVPILFWWPGAIPEQRSASAMTVDIMPTLAGLLGLSVPPAEVDGRCLDIIPGAESNCD
ncbi:alkaline phosphatase family protein [Sphingomonas sp.]|uniref:alkaline phosphatase family protein n=1 Tax=Sphingomonas sp. TaxID=28214 RepID=UPI002FCB6AA6